MLEQEVIYASIGFLAPFLSGAFGALITAWFASRRFYSERWWDRKYAAYSDVLNALHNITNDYNETLHEISQDREADAAKRKELSRARENGKNEIKRQIYIGDLVMSSSAVRELIELNRSLSRAGMESVSYVESLLASMEAINTATERIKKLAREDLDPPSRRVFSLLRGRKV